MATVAVAGNPNSGKSTVFNALTGARSHVANYPGVSVEVREGSCTLPSGVEAVLLDLPGVYSLTHYSQEELVARRSLLRAGVDAVVCVVDATNLERSLYFVTQLLEIGLPLVIALNMSDELESLGRRIDQRRLGQLLGSPVVEMCGRTGRGVDDLARAVEESLAKPRTPSPLPFGPHVEAAVHRIDELLRAASDGDERRSRYLAVKLLEEDCGVGEEGLPILSEEADAEVSALRRRLREHLGDTPEMLVADDRYGIASGIAREVVTDAGVSRLVRTERIDAWVTHRILGLPVLALSLWALFHVVFRLGAIPSEWIDTGFAALGRLAEGGMAEGPLRSLVADGLVGGVGGVLVFVPQILLLFLGIALMEDTGYLSRAAFTLDRLMHAVGLHGKSFIPLLVGLGCSAPAVLSTRILSSRRDRLVTMLIIPFVSCSARLPVFVLLTGAFFAPERGATVLLSLYAIGLAAALLSAKLLTATILKGDDEPFVMELPPYRTPTLRALLSHTWERAWEYVRKAGTVILAMSVVVWALCHFPQPAEGQSALEASVAGRAGRALEPLSRPLGFDWRINVALLAGVAAKEVVVSSLASLLGEEGEEGDTRELAEKLRSDPSFSPLVAFCMMVFVALYLPCVVTLTVVARESGSWKWPLFLACYTTAVAWLATAGAHLVGRALGYG